MLCNLQIKNVEKGGQQALPELIYKSLPLEWTVLERGTEQFLIIHDNFTLKLLINVSKVHSPAVRHLSIILALTFSLNSPFECFLLLRIVPALMSAQSAWK